MLQCFIGGIFFASSFIFGRRFACVRLIHGALLRLCAAMTHSACAAERIDFNYACLRWREGQHTTYVRTTTHKQHTHTQTLYAHAEREPHHPTNNPPMINGRGHSCLCVALCENLRGECGCTRRIWRAHHLSQISR